ncbi:TonB-dependent receptor [Chitinophaga niabensis]|uniref:SusC/RagA family TonB-linked outer membrane protein n=1 Tax=Chitinophaga niabensis TaxID=536979 RepID=UPI0031B9FB21
MIRKILQLTIIALLLLQVIVMAQTATVRGVVQNEEGLPLVGVSVSLQPENSNEKPIITVTGEKGMYELNRLAAGSKYIFTFTYVGYEPQLIPGFQIKAGEDNTLLVRMKVASSSLNEVMVIGYGTLQKKYLTGAVSRVSSKELGTYSSSSFATQLAGKASGVMINDASAQPGTDPQIVIRGVGTLTAGRDPLVVVDGFPLSEGTSFNSINPGDIETIDILKDPASAAIYGSRAANGVILITTKKGRNEKMKVSLDIYTGVQERADNVEYADAYEAAQYFTEARDWGYVSKNPANRRETDDRATRISKGASLRELRLNYIQPWLDKTPGLTNTNWLNETFRKGKMDNYSLAVSGGTQKTNYYFSGNYFKQDGLVIGNGLKRYSGTLKVESKVSPKLDFGITLNPSYSINNYFTNNGNNNTDPIGATNIMYPFFSPYNADGSLAISKQIIANTPEDGALGENTVALAKKISNVRNFFRTFGNTFLSYELLQGLKLKFMAGADYRSNYFSMFNPSDVGAYRTAAPKPASATEQNGSSINYLMENTINYARRFRKHDLNVLAGYTFQKQSGTTTDITGSGIPDDNITNIGGASSFAVTTSKYTWVQISYLSRLQYSFADKYIVSATIRKDGSSRFGKNNKWGSFPSVTAGWIASEEKFFPSSSVVTFAKLRATWGKAGNNQIGSYDSKALVSGGSAYNYVYGNTLFSGFAASSTANGNLSWETKTSTNLGFDLGLFNRFNVTLDYYNTLTTDLLLDVPVPEQSGFSSSTQNIGKVKNSGIEVTISGDVPLGNVKWNFSGNIAANKNEVKALAPGQTQIISGTESNFYTKVGGPVAELYGYNVTGIFKSQDEINKTPHLSGTIVGDYIVEDVKKDGIIDANDMIAFGTYFPKLTYGFTNNFSWQNLTLSFSLNGVAGRKIYDRQLSTLDEAGEGFAVPSKYYFRNRYHPVNNPNGFLGQPNMGNFSTARKSARTSSIFYQDADYLRLRNVQLSYNLPRTLLSRIGMSAAAVYVTGNNLFTITKYRGYNPDATTDNVLTSGQAISNYPVARSYVLGLNVTF